MSDPYQPMPQPAPPGQYGPWSAPPAYGPPPPMRQPYGYYQPPPPKARLVSPAAGWTIASFGLLLFIGSFFDWADALGGLISISGTEKGGGDGWITAALGAFAGILGVLCGLQRVHAWYPIVGAACLAAGAAIGVNDTSNLWPIPGVSIGLGLWMVDLAGSVGALAGIVATIVMIRRLRYISMVGHP